MGYRSAADLIISMRARLRVRCGDESRVSHGGAADRRLSDVGWAKARSSRRAHRGTALVDTRSLSSGRPKGGPVCFAHPTRWLFTPRPLARFPSVAKCPLRCSQASSARLGIAATAQIAKNTAQPADAAMKPAPDDRYVRPTAASAVSNAYWVAGGGGVRER